jgi:uncharacterized protein
MVQEDTMKSKVFLVRTKPREIDANLARFALKLYEFAHFDLGVSEGELVAIKQHFGEGKNEGYLRPPITRAFVDLIKAQGGTPFLNETATLYKGNRHNAVDHLNQAYAHGFTPEAVGCPIVMADGLVGASQAPVRIDQKHYKEVYVARDVCYTDAMIVLTHVTGHVAMAFGGSIKNLGMGLSSRAGKLNQHHGATPLVDVKKCTACGACARWCPVDAITVEEQAVIDADTCIGCGECFAVCPEDAIGFKWQESSVNLQEKVAEHALGVVKELKGRIVYFNFAIGVTEGCDCFDRKQKAIVPDLGILASSDPVALDSATLKLIDGENHRDVFSPTAPGSDPTVQMTYGAKIGLGSTDYELIEVK